MANTTFWSGSIADAFAEAHEEIDNECSPKQEPKSLMNCLYYRKQHLFYGHPGMTSLKGTPPALAETGDLTEPYKPRVFTKEEGQFTLATARVNLQRDEINRDPESGLKPHEWHHDLELRKNPVRLSEEVLDGVHDPDWCRQCQRLKEVHGGRVGMVLALRGVDWASSKIKKLSDITKDGLPAEFEMVWRLDELDRRFEEEDEAESEDGDFDHLYAIEARAGKAERGVNVMEQEAVEDEDDGWVSVESESDGDGDSDDSDDEFDHLYPAEARAREVEEAETAEWETV